MTRCSNLAFTSLWSTAALLVVASCATRTSSLDSEADAGVSGASRRDAAVDKGPPPDPECVPKLVVDAPVPAPYAGRRSPLDVNADVLAAGNRLFVNRCAICHGSEGRGDGRGGPYVPPAADLTAKLRDEDYLFWRISEGGYDAPFCTAMPAFVNSYSERQRWELVALVRDFAGVGDAGADASDAADATSE